VKILKEFKEFITKGNLIDLAVAFIMRRLRRGHRGLSTS